MPAKVKLLPKRRERRTSSQVGPKSRSFLKRVVSRRHRFGRGYTIDEMVGMQYDRGDLNFDVNEIGRSASREEDVRVRKRMARALENRHFYFGPKFVSIASTDLQAKFAQRLHVRKGDRIELGLSSMIDGASDPVDRILISVKSEHGKGQVFFKFQWNDNPRLFGEAKSFLIDQVERGAIKLFSGEVIHFKSALDRETSSLRSLVTSIGHTEGNALTVKVSDILRASDQHNLVPEEVIPELQRLRQRLILGKTIRLIEDQEY